MCRNIFLVWKGKSAHPQAESKCMFYCERLWEKSIPPLPHLGAEKTYRIYPSVGLTASVKLHSRFRPDSDKEQTKFSLGCEQVQTTLVWGSVQIQIQFRLGSDQVQSRFRICLDQVQNWSRPGSENVRPGRSFKNNDRVHYPQCTSGI